MPLEYVRSSLVTRARVAAAGLTAVCLAAALTRVTAEDRPRVIPFVLDNGIIYLQVGVNGSPLRSFILDTGAAYTVLDLPVAKALGLKLESIGPIEGGAGANPPEAFRVLDAVTLKLPGVAVTGKDVLAMTLARIDDCTGTSRDSGTGRPMDGILGKPFFERFVVEIDYAAREVRLHDPRKDTLQPMKNCGIGGTADETSFVGVVSALRLESLTLPRPVTVFVRDPDDAGDDGTLGNGALTGFRVIFDYARRRMILEEANRPTPADRPARTPDSR
jgi:hypothetical protein